MKALYITSFVMGAIIMGMTIYDAESSAMIACQITQSYETCFWMMHR